MWTPTERDWANLSKYACYVKTIGVPRTSNKPALKPYRSPRYVLDDALWEALGRRVKQTGPLLPRLLNLRWSAALTPPKFTSLLKAPNLRILQLNTSYGMNRQHISGPINASTSEETGLVPALLNTFVTPRLSALALEECTRGCTLAARYLLLAALAGRLPNLDTLLLGINPIPQLRPCSHCLHSGIEVRNPDILVASYRGLISCVQFSAIRSPAMSSS